jgi:hypothetical protein
MEATDYEHRNGLHNIVISLQTNNEFCISYRIYIQTYKQKEIKDK